MTANTTSAAVLLVDDRRENLLSLEALLADVDAELVMASSGPEALRRTLQQEFAVILLDVQMPGMDGLETASLIRSRRQSQHTPIVFVTAYAQDSDIVRRAYAQGAVDFLFKPVVGEILRSKVHVFVDLWNQAREIERQSQRALKAEGRELETRLAAQLEKERQQWEGARLEADLARERSFREELERSYSRLKDLEAMRDDLSHMIVHDLRSPLCSFLTGLETLRQGGELAPSQDELLALSIDGGHQLLRMINDLLDIAKLEAGQLSLLLEWCEVDQIVADAVRTVHSLAQEKEITLEVRGNNIPAWNLDGEKLRRVLQNLLGNAVKFTPRRGRIIVDVAAREDRLRLAVRDSGEGIPREAFDRIFDKFGQVESRKAGAGSGRSASTGLGLTFCKLVAEAHGGRIWVESELGRGSTFCLELPAVRDARPKLSSQAEPGRPHIDLESDTNDEAEDYADERELPLAA